MTIASYDDLKSAIERWAARDGDSNVSDQASDFVTLGESRLNRVLPLRVNKVETPLTGTIDSRSLALPSDFVEPIALFLTTFGSENWLRPVVAGTYERNTSSGTPSAWSINGDAIDINTPCDQAHTFTFRYRKSFALSDAAPTNWLLTNHPDAYLAACMVEYFLFVMNEERAAVWQQRLNAAVEEITWKDARSEANAPLSVDAAIGAPEGFNIVTG